MTVFCDIQNKLEHDKRFFQDQMFAKEPIFDIFRT